MKHFYLLLLVFSAIGIDAQNITFADSKFKAKLLESTYNDWPNYYLIAADVNQVDMVVDTNGDGEISVQEAQAVYYLNVQGSLGGDQPTDISDLAGIEYFTNLVELNCADNVLTSLDVSALTNMVTFRCDRNNITSLNIAGLVNLQSFAYGNNVLPNLDISHLVNLRELYCGGNGIVTLDVSTMPELDILFCYYNQIQTLDLSQNRKMHAIICDHNQLTFLDVSNLTNTVTSAIYVNDNPLQTLIMKNGRLYNNQDLSGIRLANCPNLSYICVDESNISAIQNELVSEYGYTQCNVNSYCSFVPGGAYYQVSGTSRYDTAADGCEVSDPIFRGLNFSVTGVADTSVFFSGGSGLYSVALQSGSYSFTPIFENPEYFVASPNALPVTFTANSQPVVQDFCVTATGQHPDLEVFIVPMDVARPGFDSHYKIVYKNKGTTTISGSLAFTFEEPKMDFISATPSFSSQTDGTIIWNYIDFTPLESRELFVTLNSNSPMESPPVNGGDQLNFGATITPLDGDETPLDNAFGFKQTVVNSYDPNDKTCIQGNVISPDLVGQYVHYVIRFENTGTADAVNIIVKDMIDTDKFDVSTLIPFSGSHPFVTRVTSGNKVEFIFENINLPFDDTNNDGYVAFKIKTLPTLTVGDTFSNTASIYFDYNFPIVTNTATTTIQLLGKPDFEFSDAFTLYPNPAQSVLNIESKNGVEVKSVGVYNMLGQLIQVQTGNVGAIDVSSLSAGQYFLKVHTDNGSAVTTFIRQ